jgi:hypothetical protein
MKFGNFLKSVFISKFWIKAITLILAVFVVLVISLQ